MLPTPTNCHHVRGLHAKDRQILELSLEISGQSDRKRYDMIIWISSIMDRYGLMKVAQSTTTSTCAACDVAVCDQSQAAINSRVTLYQANRNSAFHREESVIILHVVHVGYVYLSQRRKCCYITCCYVGYVSKKIKKEVIFSGSSTPSSSLA